MPLAVKVAGEGFAAVRAWKAFDVGGGGRGRGRRVGLVTVVHGRRLRSGRGVGMRMGRSRGVGGHGERRLHLIAWLLCGIRIRVRRVGLASELRVTRWRPISTWPDIEETATTYLQRPDCGAGSRSVRSTGSGLRTRTVPAGCKRRPGVRGTSRRTLGVAAAVIVQRQVGRLGGGFGKEGSCSWPGIYVFGGTGGRKDV